MSQAQVQDQAEYIDEVDSCSLEPSKQSSNHQNRSLPSTSKRKRPTVNTTSTPQTSSMRTSRQQPPLTDLFSSSVANADNDDMSDGSKRTCLKSRPGARANHESENEARAIRVIEIMNDFRTLQHHITSLVVRQESNPPDQAAYYLTGYVVLRECSLAAQTILATHFNPGSLGLQPGQVPATEVQKATLQRYVSLMALWFNGLRFTGYFSTHLLVVSKPIGYTYEQRRVCDGYTCGLSLPIEIWTTKNLQQHSVRLMHA